MSITITESRTGMVKKVKCTFSLSALGTTNGATTYYYDGKIERVACYTTGIGGTFTLKDDDGFDLMAGAGVYASTSYTFIPTTGAVVANSKLNFQVSTTAAGSAQCSVFIR